MSSIGQPERETQNRVIALFRDEVRSGSDHDNMLYLKLRMFNLGYFSVLE